MSESLSSTGYLQHLSQLHDYSGEIDTWLKRIRNKQNFEASFECIVDELSKSSEKYLVPNVDYDDMFPALRFVGLWLIYAINNTHSDMQTRAKIGIDVQLNDLMLKLQNGFKTIHALSEVAISSAGHQPLTNANIYRNEDCFYALLSDFPELIKYILGTFITIDDIASCPVIPEDIVNDVISDCLDQVFIDVAFDDYQNLICLTQEMLTTVISNRGFLNHLAIIIYNYNSLDGSRHFL